MNMNQRLNSAPNMFDQAIVFSYILSPHSWGWFWVSEGGGGWTRGYSWRNSGIFGLAWGDFFVESRSFKPRRPEP